MTRHLAIGDIHGCYNALCAVTEFAGLQSDDTLITLGDYVNRGPNTRAVLDWLIHRHETGRLVALRGNHEIMMLNARDDEASYRGWRSVGGKAALKSYAAVDGDRGAIEDIPDLHWDFLEHKLRPSYEIDTHFFVHANASPGIDLADQPDLMLYWEKFGDPRRHDSGKIMVCGHTSQKSGLPLTNGNAICIDTWACGRGWLSCLHVESGTIWQANEAGETRRLSLDDCNRP